LSDYDAKKAYGFRGTTYKTVMSYGDQSRYGIYSDEGFSFPDGQIAGNSRAHAKIYLENHISNVVKKTDLDNITLNSIEIGNTEMVNVYANSSIVASNYKCKNGSEVIFQSSGSITLNAGFETEAGADFAARIIDCDNSTNFKSASLKTSDNSLTNSVENDLSSNNFDIYPNPTDGLLTIVNNNFNHVESIQVFSNTGVLLNTFSPKETFSVFSIDLRGFSSGIYYIILESNSKTLQRKIIINH
jgi:hypothetical protein